MKKINLANLGQRGFKPALSDSEIITIESRFAPYPKGAKRSMISENLLNKVPHSALWGTLLLLWLQMPFF